MFDTPDQISMIHDPEGNPARHRYRLSDRWKRGEQDNSRRSRFSAAMRGGIGTAVSRSRAPLGKISSCCSSASFRLSRERSPRHARRGTADSAGGGRTCSLADQFRSASLSYPSASSMFTPAVPPLSARHQRVGAGLARRSGAAIMLDFAGRPADRLVGDGVAIPGRHSAG